MSKRKKLITLLIIPCMFISGCSLQTRRETGNDIIDSTEGEAGTGLVDGGYYVQHDNKLYKVADADKTFETGDVVSSASPERIIYFTDSKDLDGNYINEEWDKIPTLYSGDSLLYYYTDVLSETYNFERFEDVGYTIGIIDMQETLSGRYSFTLEDGYLSKTDANKVSTLPTESAIIDKVSQKELRKGNISSYGTIVGLNRNSVYEFEIYAGTVLNKMNIKADTRILGSMEVYESNDYEFLSSNVIRINIPEWFNSGYYSINGLGIFRYVVGDSYNDSTNFNVPNDEEEGIIEESTEEILFESEEQIDETEVSDENNDADVFIDLTVDEDETAEISNSIEGPIEISIIYSNIEGDGDGGIPDIGATITSENNELYEMKKDEDKLIVNIPNASEGKYKISFVERNNRSLKYKIVSIDSANENVENTENIESNEDVETTEDANE